MIFFRFDRKSGEYEIAPARSPVANPRPVTKGQLVRRIAADLELTLGDVDSVMKHALAMIAQSLKDGRPVVLSGFGRFRPRKCRTGKSRNPRTGARVKQTGRKSVTFRPSERLKRQLA